ncbi:unnamed protein product, partial [Porites evermanni]
MIKNCEYTPSTDTIVRDHVVFGIRDAKVQGQLSRIDVEKLTLEKALSHYLSAEVTNAKLKEIRHPPEEKEESRKIHTVVPLPCPDFELFVGELEVDLLDTEAWYRKMEVAGDIVNFTLDTGA